MPIESMRSGAGGLLADLVGDGGTELDTLDAASRTLSFELSSVVNIFTRRKEREAKGKMTA